jgi:hypothetical protein
MDGEDQYFKKQIDSKIPIMPHVKFWWIDEKWHQHDVIMVVAN